MSTRGFVGIKEKGEIKGWYNHSDSYYDCLGKELVEKYFKCNTDNIFWIDKGDDNNFIYDGLYCEYAYVYNKDDDVLEIYRGFFETPQWTDHGMDSEANKTKYYTHLVMIVDRKIHTKEQVLEAMGDYDVRPGDFDHYNYIERRKCPIVLRQEYSPELKAIIKLCMLEGCE